MAQTTEAMSMKDAKIEVKIGSGSWTDIGGSANEITPDGFERKKGEANTFVGDSPVMLRGKKGSGTVTIKVLYTENDAEGHLLLYNAFEDGERVQARWSPLGGASGDLQYTSDALGFITNSLPPGGESGSADPVMTEFVIACGSIAMAVIAP
jgi:hypothetical protein